MPDRNSTRGAHLHNEEDKPEMVGKSQQRCFLPRELSRSKECEFHIGTSPRDANSLYYDSGVLHETYFNSTEDFSSTVAAAKEKWGCTYLDALKYRRPISADFVAQAPFFRRLLDQFRCMQRACADPRYFVSIPLVGVLLFLLAIESFLFSLLARVSKITGRFATRSAVRRELYRARRVKTFSEYKSIAERLDELTGRDIWKEDDEAPPFAGDAVELGNYDAPLIRRKLASLRQLRSRLSKDMAEKRGLFRLLDADTTQSFKHSSSPYAFPIRSRRTHLAGSIPLLLTLNSAERCSGASEIPACPPSNRKNHVRTAETPVSSEDSCNLPRIINTGDSRCKTVSEHRSSSTSAETFISGYKVIAEHEEVCRHSPATHTITPPSRSIDPTDFSQSQSCTQSTILLQEPGQDQDPCPSSTQYCDQNAGRTLQLLSVGSDVSPFKSPLQSPQYGDAAALHGELQFLTPMHRIETVASGRRNLEDRLVLDLGGNRNLDSNKALTERGPGKVKPNLFLTLSKLDFGSGRTTSKVDYTSKSDLTDTPPGAVVANCTPGLHSTESRYILNDHSGHNLSTRSGIVDSPAPCLRTLEQALDVESIVTPELHSECQLLESKTLNRTRSSECLDGTGSPQQSSLRTKRSSAGKSLLRTERKHLHVSSRDTVYNADLLQLVQLLQSCLEGQLLGTLDPMVYSHSYSGTKRLIAEFQAEVNASLRFLAILLARYPRIRSQQPATYRMIKQLPKEFGVTSLAMSGGGMLGLHHLGVLDVLIQENLMPRFISGTSAGSAMAALVCTRTDEELRAFLSDPQACGDAFRAPFQPSNLLQRAFNYLTQGYLMNMETWLRHSERLYGEMTFLEAFQKTGRVLNICVSPQGSAKETLNLNCYSSPHVLIYTAVIASSAFPWLASPVALLEKNPNTGQIMVSSAFRKRFYQDGSLKGDIPTAYLREKFNSKFVLVSQVNVHVFPFLDICTRSTPGQPIRGWSSLLVKYTGGFLWLMFQIILKEHMRFILRVIALLEVVPSINGIDLSALAMQKYGGDLNLFPPRLYWQHLFVFNNVPQSFVEWFIQVGRCMTFAKVWLLRARLSTEAALQTISAQVSRHQRCIHSPRQRVRRL